MYSLCFGANIYVFSFGRRKKNNLSPWLLDSGPNIVTKKTSTLKPFPWSGMLSISWHWHHGCAFLPWCSWVFCQVSDLRTLRFFFWKASRLSFVPGTQLCLCWNCVSRQVFTFLGVDLLGRKPQALGSVVTPTLLLCCALPECVRLSALTNADWLVVPPGARGCVD